MFVCEVGTIKADKRGSVTRTCNKIQDQFGIFKVFACVMPNISRTVQWWTHLNSLNLFGCFAAMIILVTAPEVVSAIHT